ncbi:MAG: hypothetical protein JWN62_2556 [Acidimicrobiales bacterium]|nr:hypothetical protein [Acidimicrobiales bacterium]
MTSDEQLKMFRLTLVDSLPARQVAVATVSATTPTVLPHGHEDRQGVVDLPKRRVLRRPWWQEGPPGSSPVSSAGSSSPLLPV